MIEKKLVAAIAALCLVYIVAAVMVRPSIGVDPAYSLRVYESMQAGGPWNHLIEPDINDISRDSASFFAAMSPGQYMAAAIGMNAGLSMGVAAMLASIVVSVLALIGWYRLYHVLGFSAREALISCAVLAASRSVNLAFVTYLGGEILAFAAFPFLAAETMRLRQSKWLPLWVAVAIPIAFLAKNSLPIYFAAWITAQAAMAILPGVERRPALVPSMLAVLVAAIGAGAIDVFYVSRGWSPFANEPSLVTTLKPYVLPWSMPVLAATSWDDLFSWVFMHPSGALVPFDYRNSIAFLAAIAIASLVAATLAVKRREDDQVLQMFLYSVLIVGALSAILASGAAASLDLARHYRIIGYVWLPLMVRSMLRSKPATAVIIALLLILPGVYGLGSFASNWRRHYATRDSQSARLHITHPQLTPRMVRALATLDRELPPGALVVTPVPTYALEFLRTRALPTNVVADELWQIPKRHGRATNLIVIVDRRGISEEKCAQWLTWFPDYDRWERFDLDEHRFFVPAGQTITPAWLEAALQ